MNDFKAQWEIKKTWHFLFPILGILGLLFSAYKLTNALIGNQSLGLKLVLTLAVFYALLKLTLFVFKKLEKKWDVTYRWELIRIFIVFAITGSSSLLVGKPIMKIIGITKDNLSPLMYWVLYIVIGLLFYQFLLLFYGWLFGQFKFFWEFEKKMLNRIGFGRF